MPTTTTPKKTAAALLLEAIAAARAGRLKADPQAKPYRFAINYRLDETAPSPKGAYAVRYRALLTLVHALDAKPWHYATSSWEIFTHLGSAEVEAHLTPPLDAKIDVLTVTPIGPSKVFGDPKKLKS
jgi:hypothetical protein